jgi:hypothetical protein
MSRLLRQAPENFEVKDQGIVHLSFVIVEWRGSSNYKLRLNNDR